MKTMLAICKAIPWAARVAVSIQPIITALRLKNPTSANSVALIGQPSWKTLLNSLQSGRQIFLSSE